MQQVPSIQYFVIDFESYYDKEYSLRKMTPAEYILDPRFECIGASISVNDTGLPLWVTPEELFQFLRGLRIRQLAGERITLVSHNSLFDMCVLVWRFGFVPDLMIDTMGMARALVAARTGRVSLDVVGAHLNVGHKGAAVDSATGLTGKQIIGKASGKRRAEIEAAPWFGGYKRYACDDNDICRGIFKVLRRDFPPQEYLVMDTVLRCAVLPRLKLNHNLLSDNLIYVKERKEMLMQRALASIGTLDRSALMSNDKFADVLRSLGVDPPMKISKITGESCYAFAKADAAMGELLESDDPAVSAVVAARMGVKSTLEETRTQRLINIAKLTWPGNTEGWAPIPLRYSGAHTHRLSGDWKLNPQNWTKPDKDNPKSGALGRAHTAPCGHVVLKADSSQIEARIVAWLAKCGTLLDGFAAKKDIYSEFAGGHIYHRLVTKADVKERFVGKQAVLGLGFQMGAPRFKSQVQKDSRIILKEEIIISLGEAQGVVNAYRRAYHEIPTNCWNRLGALIPLLATQDSKIEFGPVTFRHQEIVLPTGLKLFYHDLHQRVNGEGRPEWVFKFGDKWERIFGGKLLENIVQALAACLNKAAMLKMRQLYPTVPLALQKHDELVYVPPVSMAHQMRDDLLTVMREPEIWAAGLPLDAEAAIGPSYGEAK